ADASPYELQITRQPPFICTPDRVDMMGKGNDMATAFNLPLPPTRLDGLTLCNADDDWYAFTLVAGFNNVVRLQYIGADATLDMALLDMTGAQQVATGGGGDYKQVTVTVPGAGIIPWFIHVFRSAGSEAAYNITQDLVPIFSCFPDFAEPNETA